jgi:hypothetical protein
MRGNQMIIIDQARFIFAVLSDFLKRTLMGQEILVLFGEKILRQFQIEIAGKGIALAELDRMNPKIAEAFWQMLPIDAEACLWGEEIYFNIPLQTADENPSPSASAADISYWSPGPAFCIFFGKTQPYSPVNHLGKIVEGLDLFRDVKARDRIALNRK